MDAGRRWMCNGVVWYFAIAFGLGIASSVLSTISLIGTAGLIIHSASRRNHSYAAKMLLFVPILLGFSAGLLGARGDITHPSEPIGWTLGYLLLFSLPGFAIAMFTILVVRIVDGPDEKISGACGACGYCIIGLERHCRERGEL